MLTPGKDLRKGSGPGDPGTQDHLENFLTYTFSGPTTDPTKLDSPTASPQNLSFCNNSNIIMVIDSH